MFREHSLHGTKLPGKSSQWELSFLWAKVPSGNFCFEKWKYRGAKSPRTISPTCKIGMVRSSVPSLIFDIIRQTRWHQGFDIIYLSNYSTGNIKDDIYSRQNQSTAQDTLCGIILDCTTGKFCRSTAQQSIDCWAVHRKRMRIWRSA